MRKILFVLASTGSLATMNVATAQYPASEYYATGNYVPGYYGRRYYAPGGSVGATVGTNNAGNTGFVGGECAKGFSEETCRRRGQKYNPPGQN
ncbi:MAG: hypothetical protein WAN42_20705 [Pseudolabrys sp.]